jgi:glucosylceramidase
MSSFHSSATVLLGLLGLGLAQLRSVQGGPLLQSWCSTTDLKQQLQEQAALRFDGGSARGLVLKVDESRTCQTMLGLGSSLEPSTCSNLWRLDAAERARVMNRLVNPTNGIGMNLMRICIGTPDFTGDPWYSYDDLPTGDTDPDLRRFSIARDRQYILPILKLARANNPDLLFFASPWSPPGWMKSTGTMIGGSVLPQHYAVYAEYFVRFIQAYKEEGIPIFAVTVQNEPGVDRAKEKNPKWFYPSCRWTGQQERDFIRDYLGPVFRKHGLKTQIWSYDHNYNRDPSVSGDDPGLAYPRAVLSDARAAGCVAGVAFHGYAGRPEDMSAFHQEFPNVPLYFTEGSTFGLDGAGELIARLRNWASGYNAWVTMLDNKGEPNNGPFPASRTCVTLETGTLKPSYHFDFFMYGQFMKFVRRGAKRIESTADGALPANVAFQNPDGSLVLIVVNNDSAPKPCAIEWRGQQAPLRLTPQSVTTFVWNGSRSK